MVRWEAGSRRDVAFAIENPTNRTIAIAAPDPANARVEVYAGSEAYRVCGVAPSGPAAPAAPVAIAPGDRVAVRVDLRRACGALPPGEYRYVVSYEAPPPATPPREDAFSGTLPARYGQVLVPAPAAAAAAVCAPPPEPRTARSPARQARAAPEERKRAARPRRPEARREPGAEGAP